MYLDLQSYQNCPQWKRGEVQEENGMRLGKKKKNAGQTRNTKTKRQEISTLTCLARSSCDVEQNKQAPTNQLFC